jgi:hypothetical protein
VSARSDRLYGATFVDWCHFRLELFVWKKVSGLSMFNWLESAKSGHRTITVEYSGESDVPRRQYRDNSILVGLVEDLRRWADSEYPYPVRP